MVRTVRGKALTSGVVASAVAIGWVAVHFLATRVFPDQGPLGSRYRNRDDAIITLSHARGLVAVGAVSIGASGSRVEGFSAPLQFVVDLIYSWLGGSGYSGLFTVQTVLSTAVLGASAYLVIRLAAPRRAEVASALVATLIALPLFMVYSFFAWHTSGMENSITNAMIALSLAAVAWAIVNGRGFVVAGVIAGLASVTRDEFIFHLAPFLVVAAWLLIRSGRGRRSVVALIAPAATIWIGVQAVRFWYFGSLVPNTGSAQGIAPFANLRTWAGVAWPLLAIPIVIVAGEWWRRHQPNTRVASAEVCVAVTAVAVGAATFLVVRHDQRTPLPGLDALAMSARVLGLWWWLGLAVILLGLLMLTARLEVVHVLASVLVATGVCHILVFGPARLAGERVATFVLVPLLLLVAASGMAIEWGVLGRMATSGLGARVGAFAVVVLVVVPVVGWWTQRSDWQARYTLCCDPSVGIPRILATASRLSKQSGVETIQVANPDIGRLTLDKQVNVTDLGLLGDPLLNEIWHRATKSGRMGVLVRYLNDYAKPDVVESHGVYSCQFAPWLLSRKFAADYERIWSDGWSEGWISTNCPSANGLGGGIWVRKELESSSGSREVVLSRRLARDPSPRRVAIELRRCHDPASETACQYVTRSVYRNLAAFADAGTLAATIREFHTPSDRYDRAVLSSRDHGTWYRDAADYLFARHRHDG